MIERWIQFELSYGEIAGEFFKLSALEKAAFFCAVAGISPEDWTGVGKSLATSKGDDAIMARQMLCDIVAGFVP